MNRSVAFACSRRAWLTAALALLPTLPALADEGADSGADRWLPYDPAQVKVLMPETVIAPQTFAGEFLQAGEPAGFKRVDPVLTRRRSVHTDAVDLQPLRQPPTAYVLTARRLAVPAWVLFGVALQESQLLFGHEALPWPWTLDVDGRAERHRTYQSVREALTGYLRRGVTNVDCGAMQVNWRAHSGLLGTPGRALDPYANLAAGASILRQGFAATGSWPQAVGLYHTGSFGSGERRARAVRYVAGVSRRLSHHGLTLAQAAAITAVGQERRHG